MAYRFLSADWVYPVSSPRRKEGVIVVDGDQIVGIEHRNNISEEQIEYVQGILIPGFVNAHCHLELSHLKGRVDTGTGLLAFIERVVRLRESTREDILTAIQEADADMWSLGINAVGDISNTSDTFETKARSRIAYYTFIEVFDFMQGDKMKDLISGNIDVYHHAPPHRSAVPHAPYSVSKSLFEKINTLNQTHSTVSIHNQETPAEEELFMSGSGGFYSFYHQFGFTLDAFRPTGKSSIHYAMEHMDPQQRTLFVHNTLTSPEDIQAAHAWSDQVYWATCPNANLYIENRLPNYQQFMTAKARMCIGTDSLTSNWQLSILEEMKTIARYQSYVPFDDLLQWATLHGAEALGMQDQLGSFEPGKKPGVLVLTMDPETDRIQDEHVRVSRII